MVDGTPRGYDDSTLTLEVGPVGDRPWLLEVGGPSGTQLVTLSSGDSVVLGSSRQADLTVTDRAMSARHARVSASNDGLEVVDLGSKNGLFVGAARVRRAAVGGAATAFVIGRTSVVARPEDRADTIEERLDLPGMVGESTSMCALARQIHRLAPLSRPVLIQGETGTGKDLIALALHQLSGRKGRYVPLNVGGVPEALADAALFGQCRGAFTGAVVSRPGSFEEADAGTLFLDEIADLPVGVQVKLLRVVEDGLVRRLGSSDPIRVDTRVVSASWASLEERVDEEKFRQDLLHRISTFVIAVPPLRRRKSDIPALSVELLRRMEPEIGPKRLTSPSLACLVAHHWPGNVRELGSVLYRAAVVAEGVTIEPRHVDLPARNRVGSKRTSVSPAQARELLEDNGGNISAAARAARVPRTTFRAWLERTAG